MSTEVEHFGWHWERDVLESRVPVVLTCVVRYGESSLGILVLHPHLTWVR